MRRSLQTLLPACLCLLITVGCDSRSSTPKLPEQPQAPIAMARPHQVVAPAGTRQDDYYWLRDDTRSNPEMLSYLKAENAYADAMLAHTKPLQDQLYKEIVGRIKQDDATVPVRQRDYWYYRRYETGKEYPIYARKHETLEAPEQMLVDANARSQGHGYYRVGSYSVSPDNKLLAWTEDTVGRRQYALRVNNQAT